MLAPSAPPRARPARFAPPSARIARDRGARFPQRIPAIATSSLVTVAACLCTWLGV